MVEAIANVQHEIWSHWMKYLFSCSLEMYGGVLIPRDKMVRWKRQMETAYAGLTEKEKNSDRDQANKVMEAIEMVNTTGVDEILPESEPWNCVPEVVEVPADQDQETMFEIWQELVGARAQFPWWPTDPLHALAIVTEELGEVQKDILQRVYEPGKPSAVEKEAIQLAAMALRFAFNLSQYRYEKSDIHRDEN